MIDKQQTFLGLPYRDPLDQLSADIAILGIPHGTPYYLNKLSHSATAPEAIRAASTRYAGKLDHWDFDLGGPLLNDTNISVVDCGDVEGDPWNSVRNSERAQTTTQNILSSGAIPIILGGDDSVVIPFLRAFENHGPIHIIQIDAHIDWRDEFNGVKEGWSSVMRRASEMPWVDQLFQIGIRGVGSARQEEVKAARSYGAHIFTAAQIHANGIEQIIDRIPKGSNCVITLDCDGLDPSIMPAVAAPAPGGLLYDQLIRLLHKVSTKARVIGFDLVELAPDRDTQGLATLTAYRIIANMLGSLARSDHLTYKK